MLGLFNSIIHKRIKVNHLWKESDQHMMESQSKCYRITLIFNTVSTDLFTIVRRSDNRRRKDDYGRVFREP